MDTKPTWEKSWTQLDPAKPDRAASSFLFRFFSPFACQVWCS
jgi:hypothetical protein